MIRHHEMDYFDVPTSYFYNIIIDVILMKNENAIGDKWYTNFIKSNSFHDYLLIYLLTRLCFITCHEMSLIWLVMIYHLSLSAFSIINDTYLSKDTKIQWYIGLFYVFAHHGLILLLFPVLCFFPAATFGRIADFAAALS